MSSVYRFREIYSLFELGTCDMQTQNAIDLSQRENTLTQLVKQLHVNKLFVSSLFHSEQANKQIKQSTVHRTQYWAQIYPSITQRKS